MKPRVTEIIAKLGLSKSYEGIDPFYKDRGTAVHLAAHFYLKGTLDQNTLDPVVKPYFDGVLKFWKDHGTKDFKSELHLENDIYQGTMDLLTDRVWDYKCTKKIDPFACELQGAAYKKLAGNDKPFSIVQLPGDGTYKIIELPAPIELWDAVLRLYALKVGK